MGKQLYCYGLAIQNVKQLRDKLQEQLLLVIYAKSTNFFNT